MGVVDALGLLGVGGVSACWWWKVDPGAAGTEFNALGSTQAQRRPTRASRKCQQACSDLDGILHGSIISVGGETCHKPSCSWSWLAKYAPGTSRDSTSRALSWSMGRNEAKKGRGQDLRFLEQNVELIFARNHATQFDTDAKRIRRKVSLSHGWDWLGSRCSKTETTRLLDWMVCAEETVALRQWLGNGFWDMHMARMARDTSDNVRFTVLDFEFVIAHDHSVPLSGLGCAAKFEARGFSGSMPEDQRLLTPSAMRKGSPCLFGHRRRVKQDTFSTFTWPWKSVTN